MEEWKNGRRGEYFDCLGGFILLRKMFYYRINCIHISVYHGVSTTDPPSMHFMYFFPYSTLLFCTVSHCRTFFSLHSFYAVFFLCCLFLMLHSFQVALSSSDALISCCPLFRLYSFILHYFSIALFTCCNFRMCTLPCCTFSILLFFILHFFHAVFFLLYFFLVAFPKSIHNSSFAHISYNRETFPINLYFLT